MSREPLDEWQSRQTPMQENMHWQRREWRLQRIGSLLLFAVVILGCCGLFSKGFLSNQKIISSDGRLEVEYERFGLRDSNMSLTIRELKPFSGPFVVTLNSEEMDNFQIQTLQPPPLHASSDNHGMTLFWPRDSVKNGASVWIVLQPQNPGRYQVTVTNDHGSQLRFTQWIYP